MARILIFCATVFIICNIVCKLATADRTIVVEVNPNCTAGVTECEIHNSTELGDNLVYVRATGSVDTLHYLWSSVGSLSLLFAVTDPTSNIAIDWKAFLANSSESITFNPKPSYAAVVTFTNLFVYNDKDDEVDVSHGQNVTSIALGSFPWQGVDVSWSTNQASASFRSSDVFGNDHGQLLQFNLNAYGYKDHTDKLPSLLHTENSFQLEMILDHFNKTFDNTRYAVEISVVSSEGSKDEYQLDTHKSIDDEYTPGVFTVVELTSSNSRDGNNGAYLQWKPVCYTSTDRTTADSTVTQQSLIKNTTGLVDSLNSSLANAYFGIAEKDDVSMAWMSISYGLHDDGFYDTYLSWTVTIGTGRPSQESFSTMVIAIIIVGFGVPAILIIIAGIIILVRRCRSSRNSESDGLTRSTEHLVDEDQ